MSEPRKASDILLSLESQVSQLVALYRSQDLVLKVLSNKLNNLIETVGKLNQTEETNNNTLNLQVPHSSPVPIFAEYKLPQEVAPKGFRRTSRPETYTTQEPIPKPQRVTLGQITAPPPEPTVEFPVQFPEFAPSNQPSLPAKKPSVTQPQETRVVKSTGSIPVQQRLVDQNGKAIFLANIDIINLQTGETVFSKLRTNGVGKWQASLSPGAYQVKISKQESLSKTKLELSQDIMVDGLSPTQELPMLICK